MIVPGNPTTPSIGPQVEEKYLMMAAAMMHEEGRLVEPPASWSKTGVVNTPEEDAQLTEFEKTTSESTAKKYKKDDQGRLQVPSDWDAPSGFRGRVVTPGGMELNYPGVMRRRTYVK